MQSNLSFYISGNKRSHEGFSTLLVIGTPRFLPDGTHPGLDNNAEYYVVQNTPADTLLTLVNNNVSSVGAARRGLLKVAIAIPAGYRLAGGVSPHTLLRELYDLYMATYMQRGFGGAQFTERQEEAATFLPVLARYPLEPSVTPIRPMTGSEAALVPADEGTAAALMLDTAYPEFTPYREIILAATSCGVLPTLGITVPRPPIYTVWVNDRNIGVVNLAQQPRILVTASAPDQYHTTARLEFDIDEARTGRVNGVTVIDREEIIRCTLRPPLVTRKCRLVVTGLPADTPIDLTACTLVSDMGRKTVEADGSFLLTGREIDAEWRPRCSQPAVTFGAARLSKQADGTIDLIVTAKVAAASERRAQGTSTSARTMPHKYPDPASKRHRRRRGFPPLWAIGAIIAIGFFVTALGIGYFFYDNQESPASYSKKNTRDKKSKLAQQDKPEAPSRLSRTPEEQQYEDYLADLQTTDFLFADLKKMDSFCKANQAIDTLRADTLRLSGRIKVYLLVGNKLNVVDTPTLETWLGEKNPLRLTDEQQRLIRILCTAKNPNKFKDSIPSFTSIERMNKKLNQPSPPPSPKPTKKEEPPSSKPANSNKKKVKDSTKRKEGKSQQSKPRPQYEEIK